MLEEQVQLEVFTVNDHAFLALDNGKSAAQLQDEGCTLAQEGAFKVGLVVRQRPSLLECQVPTVKQSLIRLAAVKAVFHVDPGGAAGQSTHRHFRMALPRHRVRVTPCAATP